MKQIFIAALATVLFSCGGKSSEVSVDLVNNPATASGEETNGKVPVFDFDYTEFDFGTIKQGQKVKKTFTFNNTGNAALAIIDAKGSCGCTVPTYPKDPIAPGDKGEIEVVFDSAGKSGEQNKTITITANTSPTSTVLTLKGNIEIE